MTSIVLFLSTYLFPPLAIVTGVIVLRALIRFVRDIRSASSSRDGS